MNDPKLYQDRHGGWHLRFYDPSRQPQRKSISLGTKDAKTAKRRARRNIVAWEKGELDPWQERRELRVEEVVQRYMEYKSDLGRKPWTMKSYESVLRGFSENFAGRCLSDLKVGEIEAFCYAARPNYSVRSKERRMMVVRGLYRWAEERELTGMHRIIRVKPPRPERGPRFFFTREQWSAVLRELRSTVGASRTEPGSMYWLLDAALLGLSTGLRRGTLVKLEWGDIDFDGGMIHIPPGKAKRGGYSLPLFPMARRALADIPRESDYVLVLPGGEPICSSQEYVNDVSRQFTHAVRRAGVKRGTFHTLRHTFASWLVEDGVDIYQVSKWLGHTTVTTTEVYAHLAPARRPKEAAKTFI